MFSILEINSLNKGKTQDLKKYKTCCTVTVEPLESIVYNMRNHENSTVNPKNLYSKKMENFYE